MSFVMNFYPAGNIKISDHAMMDFRRQVEDAITAFRRVSRGDLPQFLLLSPIGYSTLYACFHNHYEEYKYLVDIDANRSIRGFRELTVLCIPKQTELIQVLGYPDYELFMEMKKGGHPNV